MTKGHFLFIIVLLTIVSCGQFWGENDLGDNFSLLEGDRTEDRVIVYCSGRSIGACTVGTLIVPVYSRHMDKEGHYAEYVEIAATNNKFIIARTIQLADKKKNYWIISKDLKIQNCDMTDCDSIIQSHVIGPLDISQFQNKMTDLSIDLQFNED
jgi:hypothetical protein